MSSDIQIKHSSRTVHDITLTLSDRAAMALIGFLKVAHLPPHPHKIFSSEQLTDMQVMHNTILLNDGAQTAYDSYNATHGLAAERGYCECTLPDRYLFSCICRQCDRPVRP